MLIKRDNSKIIKFLLVTIGIIYLLFLYMDIFNVVFFITSNILKFISIILCFIISLLSKEYSVSIKDTTLLRLGLFITIIADLFLLVLDSHYIIGVFLFSIVQILYIIRYDNKNTKRQIKFFITIFLSLLLIYMALDFFIIEVDFLLLVGLFYAICLIISVLKGIKAYENNSYPSPNKYLIAIGMIFFLFCDINVFLYNFLGSIFISSEIVEKLYNISFIAMWLFYLPSQVLLAISGHKFSK